MSSDEFHQYAPESVRHVHDQPILVPAEIKDDAIIGNEIDGRAELSLHIDGATPFPPSRCSEPKTDRSFRLRVTLPKLFQRPTSDHLHAPFLSRHQNGDNPI
jgi:hypothetical protein